MKNTKISKLQTYLTVLFTTSLLISNIVANKQLSLPFGITMTGAIFIFPVTYVLSDLFSEVYGYKWSRITCYLAFAMNLLMVAVFTLVIKTPAPSYWLNQEAFKTVLGNTPRVLFASLTGFIVGDFANDLIFQKLKSKHNDIKGFGTRAILSSVLGECIDSTIFLPVAFGGLMPAKVLVKMAIVQVSLKVLYEILILPFTTIAAKKVTEYESR